MLTPHLLAAAQQNLAAAPHTGPSIGSEPRLHRAHGWRRFDSCPSKCRSHNAPWWLLLLDLPHSPTASWPMARWTTAFRNGLYQSKGSRLAVVRSRGVAASLKRNPARRLALVSATRSAPVIRLLTTLVAVGGSLWIPGMSLEMTPALSSSRPAAAGLAESSSSCRAAAIWQSDVASPVLVMHVCMCNHQI